MSLPIIATNWSGTTAFIDTEVAFPLQLDRLEDVAAYQHGNSFQSWKGHRWAKPSLVHLRQLLRSVVSQPGQAKVKGAKARERMTQKFGLRPVADAVAAHFQRINARV